MCPRRLVVCNDGTWFCSDKGEDNIPSNVARLSRILAREYTDKNGEKGAQVLWYNGGVGTGGAGILDSTWQAAFGTTLGINVAEAYNFIATNYKAGDEIFIFGFSRGAYTARSLAGLLTERGLLSQRKLEYFPQMYKHYRERNLDTLKANDDEHAKGLVGENVDVYKFKDRHDKDAWVAMTKVNVKVIGVWDTVGSLGLPDSAFTRMTNWNDKYRFHDTKLNKRISNAFHALAIDEHRGAFSPSMWFVDKTHEDTKHINLKQCWFPGYHADIGGGTTVGHLRKADIDDITLAWMCDQIDGLLAFDESAIEHVLLDNRGWKENRYYRPDDWAVGEIKDPYGTVYKMSMGGGHKLRTPGQYYLEEDKDNNYVTNETIHPSVRYRMSGNGGSYKPAVFCTEHKNIDGSIYSHAWKYEDKKDGAGAEWVKPSTEKIPGRIWGEWVSKRDEVRLKEWVIRRRSGRWTNFEFIVTPETVHKELTARNSLFLTDMNGFDVHDEANGAALERKDSVQGAELPVKNEPWFPPYWSVWE